MKNLFLWGGFINQESAGFRTKPDPTPSQVHRCPPRPDGMLRVFRGRSVPLMLQRTTDSWLHDHLHVMVRNWAKLGASQCWRVRLKMAGDPVKGFGFNVYLEIGLDGDWAV